MLCRMLEVYQKFTLFTLFIYSPDSNNLNNFIAKLRAFKIAEENRELTQQDLQRLSITRDLQLKNV